MTKQEHADFGTLAYDMIREHIQMFDRLGALVPVIAEAADLMVDAYKRGGKTIFFGNGGSAADSQHLAAEMECRFYRDRRPLPSLALNANSSSVTAISNDYAYEDVFARQVRAHAHPVDVLIAISTSGRSKNVIKAAALKPELGFRLITLTGENSGELGAFADVAIAVPATATPRIQEAHIFIGHMLCEWVERTLFADNGR